MIVRRAPAPIGDGAFYLYRPQQVEESLRALAVGAPTARSILVPDALPDEKDVRAIERQVRSTYMGRWRRALGWVHERVRAAKHRLLRPGRRRQREPGELAGVERDLGRIDAKREKAIGPAAHERDSALDPRRHR